MEVEIGWDSDRWVKEERRNVLNNVIPPNRSLVFSSNFKSLQAAKAVFDQLLLLDPHNKDFVKRLGLSSFSFFLSPPSFFLLFSPDFLLSSLTILLAESPFLSSSLTLNLIVWHQLTPGSIYLLSNQWNEAISTLSAAFPNMEEKGDGVVFADVDALTMFALVN